jgi:DUF438 domain-containing protein
MSEFLQNDPARQEKIKGIIKRLHDGEPMERVRRDFARIIADVSPVEIASMEQQMIREGMPVSEVQRLCDVHVDVFKATMTKEKGRAGNISGHPIHNYRLENREAKNRVRSLAKRAKALFRSRPGAGETARAAFTSELDGFSEIEKHYARKENQLFPFLERVGFTGPSTVMWGKHDEIRGVIKSVRSALAERNNREVLSAVKDLSVRVKKMIFMEERILFPNALKRLGDEDWVAIRRGEAEIGYAWIKPGNLWDANIAAAQVKLHRASIQKAAAENKPVPAAVSPAPGTADSPSGTEVSLDTGLLTPQQINLMLKSLPIDVTFVDENDTVRYYSAGSHRVFPRSPGIIGRKVQNCHPPKSVHVVEKIVEAFREGSREPAEFWINMKGAFVHIRYFPLFDDAGTYRGVIEVSQEVSAIRALEGEKRLLD